MSTVDTKNEEIIDHQTWLGSKSYWEKFLWSLCFEKDVIEEADLALCYNYLLEDYGLLPKELERPEISFPDLNPIEEEDADETITIDSIDNLQNINALDNEFPIKLGKGLTVVYGDNGAGKSGLGRLLSNACSSRKPRTILPNVREVEVGDPSADFHVSRNGKEEVINYKYGDSNAILRSFSVFDHESAAVHLNDENKVGFVPSQMHIFDKVFRVVRQLEELLKADLQSKDVENTTENLLVDPSATKAFLESLSYRTTEAELRGALEFTDTDKKNLEEKKKEVAKLVALNVADKKELLENQAKELRRLKETLETQTSSISESLAKEINAEVTKVHDFEEVVMQLGADTFDFEGLTEIGSEEWKAFITTAKALHDKESALPDGHSPEHCLLCRQPLSERENTLFGQYWEFLASTAEADLASAKGALNRLLEKCRKLSVNWQDISKNDLAVKILIEKDPSYVAQLTKGFIALKAQLDKWQIKARKGRSVTFIDPVINLDGIEALALGRIKSSSKLVDPKGSIDTLQGHISGLTDKETVSRLLPKVLKYVEWLKWKEKSDGINLPAVRSAITRRKNTLMEELVVSDYLKKFNEEVEKLDCEFELAVDTHGEDGETVKSLKLDFAREYKPKDILSEGEQKASALADFFAETAVSKLNSGVIFDDPVSSLDHSRKLKIADRIIEEAKARQVVVLTHDIAFLLDINNKALKQGVDLSNVSMRRSGERIGVVKETLPWFAMPIKDRIGYLRNDLVRIKKLEVGDEDKYRKEVKGWYEELREAWERAVEEKLLNGVVQRFQDSVQTNRLKKIPISADLIDDVDAGMTECSQWCHDMAAGRNPKVPSVEELTAELQKLDDCVKECNQKVKS